jgi:GNAT superfamily N-acetyltransferase
LPTAEHNALRTGPGRDLGEVDAFARELSATGLPWSIQVRGEVDEELRELAARYGRTPALTRPLLLWDAGLLPGLPAAMPEGAAVRKVPGAEAKVLADAMAAGFGMPQEAAQMIALPAFLDSPGVTAFVLDLRGEAVATGLNAIVGDYAGMYIGSVPPRHRGNGYYRALVTARLADAVARGARYAFSHNTPMSRPLYESLGFRIVETWSYLTPSDS